MLEWVSDLQEAARISVVYFIVKTDISWHIFTNIYSHFSTLAWQYWFLPNLENGMESPATVGSVK
jgi:hypothetical protein